MRIFVFLLFLAAGTLGAEAQVRPAAKPQTEATAKTVPMAQRRKAVRMSRKELREKRRHLRLEKARLKRDRMIRKVKRLERRAVRRDRRIRR
jgi:hypothetical protein